MKELLVQKAGNEDLPAILNLQKTAYISEAKLLQNYNIQPLTQTLDDLKKEQDHSLILKASTSEHPSDIIASIRAYREKETVHVGKLIVHPDYQGLGYGSFLLSQIEIFLPSSRYELFTSSRSKRNLSLYGRHGYMEFKRENNSGIEIIFLEKII